MFGHILIHESKVICHYIDLNFSVCKIIGFTLKSLKEMLNALGLSQVVTKRKPLKLGEMVPEFLQKGTTA